MPTYEFRCPDGHDFEKFYRTISGAESTATCPQCGQPAERVMSTAGFSFKGSGFYLTDYGKNAHREKGSSETKTGAAAGDAGAGDSEGAAKAEKSGSGESAPAAPAGAASSGESKTGSGKPDAKAEPKPAATPAKKSTSE
jgi:putative FmdB family regulatory protein